MLFYCMLIIIFLLGILGICQFAALTKLWPYDLSLSLKNYRFDLMDGGGWLSYFNSIRLSLYTALFGTLLIFTGAYLVEKVGVFNSVAPAFNCWPYSRWPYREWCWGWHIFSSLTIRAIP